MTFLPFILRRLISGIFAVAGVSVLVFLFLHMTPGDPVDMLAGGEALPEQREEIARCLYLDRSLPDQFGIFLKNIANGTLGHQCPNPEGKPTVMNRVVDAFPYTMALAVGGMLVAIVLALPLGIIAAVHRGTWTDAVAAVVSLSGLSIHVAFMGPIMLMVFFVGLGVLPGPAEPDGLAGLVMPSIVIGTHLMAMLSRMTRSSLVDVLRADYMITARAKGLSRAAVVVKHGLRNAILPVITVAGLQFGGMLAGAILVEKIFARPGLGTLLLEGISERNYPLVQGVVLVIALIYVMVNLLVDVLYGVAESQSEAGMKRWLHRLDLSPSAYLGLGLVVLFVLSAVLGPLLAPHAPVASATDLDNRFLSPSSDHWLGTDHVGTDVLSAMLYGARIALVISVVVVAICAVVGTALGIIAGYYRGIVDDVIMRVVNVLLAFPGILLNIAIIAVVASPGLGALILALTINGWVRYARLVRGQVLSLRELEYVSAARCAGCSNTRIMVRYILPNLLSPILVMMSLNIGGVIMVEASLSFLGLGPGVEYTWGKLLDQGTTFMGIAPRLVLAPGVAIMLVVLGSNLLGDGLRDRFDPKRQKAFRGAQRTRP